MYSDNTSEEGQGQQMICPSFTDVSPGTVGPFVATCSDGKAQVSVFARDDSFSGLSNIIAAMPGACEASAEATDKHSTFTFTIPCSSEDTNFCDNEEPCDPEDEPGSVEKEDRESGGGFGDPHLKVRKSQGVAYLFFGSVELVIF